ncbi:hypothetical protein EU546_02290 [Candidatus Thorarchaeota archaeon]|nr:MAG: hypothetical protein EU546_02290 [Candidatus Thorarchaeota archaeon]
MICVGSSEGFDILAPDDAYLSYLNSPYTGHSLGTAVDIYPRHEKWSGPVCSPITGTIARVKEIRMGRAKGFPTEDLDYAIGISPDGQSGHLLRVLHCRPKVSVGDEVVAGDRIGSCLRSRYFNYWTGPHYHVEVVPETMFSRSTKSVPLTLPLGASSKVRESEEHEHTCQVIVSRPGRVVCISETLPIARFGPFFGHMIKTQSGTTGIIDAGIPHYERGGIFSAQSVRPRENIFLWNSRVGSRAIAGTSLRLFKTNRDLRVYLNGERALGLSLFLYPESLITDSLVPIVIIPQRYGAFSNLVNKGDSVALRIEDGSPY